VWIRGAREEIFRCDGIGSGGKGGSVRGMGVGEGKSWPVANPRRNCNGASISQGQCMEYLSVCM
jgi:hypothetical protein